MTYQQFRQYQEAFLPFGASVVTSADLWYFEHNEAKIETILKSADYYVEAIDHNKAYLKVSLGVVFSSDISVNAKATVYKGDGLIVWHAGLLLKQMIVIDKEKEINNAIRGTVIETVLPALDNPVNILFFQTLQHFTFHHEFGHIIKQPHLKCFLYNPPKSFPDPAATISITILKNIFNRPFGHYPDVFFFFQSMG